MNTAILRTLVGFTTVLGAAVAAQAQPGPMTGKAVYEDKCAGCHGLGGKGDGPVSPFLTRSAGDLTTIALRNGGRFPTELVWDVIDGRSAGATGPHGSREMPIWGQEFREEALRTNRGSGSGAGSGRGMGPGPGPGAAGQGAGAGAGPGPGAGPGAGTSTGPSPEWHTRNRIVALLDYLQSLQAK